VHKKPFVFTAIMWLLHVRTTTGGTEQIRVCVSRYDQSAQNHRQKVFTRWGFAFAQGGLILKIC